MNTTTSGEKSHFPAFALWGLIYLTLAFLSLTLDDPERRVTMVWFPAGAAVSAYLSLPCRFWPALYIMFFALRTGLDTLMRHSPETSLVISLISLSGDLMVALAVYHFGRQRDGFRKACIWLISTLIVSALAAVAGAGWLVTRYPLSFSATAVLWWAANASGNIVATTVLTGVTWEPARRSSRDIAKTLTGIMLVALTAALIFSLPAGKEASMGLMYGLACLPVLLTAAVPIAAGAQAGALAFLALSVIVIFCSWHQQEPFFVEGLWRGEPLLLAQGYLSGTAVLTIFVRLLLRLPEARGESQSSLDDEVETAFRLDTRSGQLDWDVQGAPALVKAVAQLPDRNRLLGAVDDDVRKKFISRWDQVATGNPVEDTLVFRLVLTGGESVMVRERGLFFLPNAAGGFLVGYWTPLTGSSALVHTEKR